MKILKTSPFSSPIVVDPGDTLLVTWRDRDNQVAWMKTKIEKDQVLDTAVLVDYEPDEARELGFEEALGIFAGEAIDEDAR